MEPTREQLTDSAGKPLTQSLFLENGYTDFAVYTLKDEDLDYKGRFLPSIKKLYLEMEDTTEYLFATTYFLGWQHWKRICKNKLMKNEVEGWREELELKLRAKGINQAIKHASEGNFQAAKWLSDKGWDKRQAGRPSTAEVEHERKVAAKLKNEFADDIARLQVVK